MGYFCRLTCMSIWQNWKNTCTITYYYFMTGGRWKVSATFAPAAKGWASKTTSAIVKQERKERLDRLGCTGSRYRPRFFDQVGHQTTSAYIESKHFFTKSCHCQTRQNYEQPPQSLQNFYFQNHFLAPKIKRIFLNFFSCEEYLTRRSTFLNEIFWKLWFLKYFFF